jgi:cyclophilin family peptidyl-prolyl cis-trans isomerase/protein-disulfide isomerase
MDQFRESMPIKILAFLFISLFFLSSCAPAAAPGTASAVPTALTIVLPTPPPTQPACTSIDLEATPGPDTPSLFPPISADDHTRGPADAPVTILLYNDFQCSNCNYLPLSRRLLEEHAGDVRFAYRHYPYTAYFDKGELAARAAEAAARQDKFWEMHDLLFEKQADWVDLPVESFEGWVTGQAAELELDQARFTADFSSTETVQKVRADAEEGSRIGITYLPLILLNGQIYRGPTDYEAFNQVINLIRLGERQFAECPAMTIDPGKQYIATLVTEKGEIVLQLYPDKAPLAVNSFVFLARNGWYDGVTFHRVLPGFVAQTGDPSGTGQGNPGYLFDNEIDPALKFDRAGVVGMANSGPDTNGSQFFITYAPAPNLDGGYTIFGRVLSGMQVLEELAPRDPQPGVHLPPGDTLIKVTIEEK